MKSEWKNCCLCELVTIKYGKNQKKVVSDNGDFPIYGTGGLIGYATEPLYDKPSVLIGRKGTINKVRYVDYPFWTVDTLFYTVVNENIVIPKFLYYILSKIDFMRYNEGTTIPSLRVETLNRIELSIPDFETQFKIVSVLSALDDKIELNNKINQNLEEQAQTIFNNMFPDVINGTHTVGEYIKLKRGKSLVSKNAVSGDVPVVAGGLKPAFYHNKANTTAPVITVSASGSNVGYVQLWSIPVWSSDSSFIDSTMTENVYFWYVMLKKRQEEIYKMRTGSVQQHIYPQHIEILPVCELNKKDISEFNDIVSSLFNKIDENKQENKSLSALRDALLPELMKGRIDISKVKEV